MPHSYFIACERGKQGCRKTWQSLARRGRWYRLVKESGHVGTRSGDGESSSRTTKLYDRRGDEPTVDEYEKVGFNKN